MHSLWYNILYYHSLCTISTITQVTWQDQKDKSIRLSQRQKGCLANYTSVVYMWARHSVNHSTTASQYKRQQWAQFVEAKKRIETQNWYFSYLTKGVYSLHKEMTLQNRHTVIGLQQVWWGTIVDHYGHTQDKFGQYLSEPSSKDLFWKPFQQSTLYIESFMFSFTYWNKNFLLECV